MDVELEKIHHVMMHHAIHEVADHAPEDQSKRHLAKRRLRPEMTPRHPQENQRRQREERQPEILPAEQAPRSPRVAEVDEFKKTVHHGHRFPVAGKSLNHNPLGQLIQGKDQQGDKEDPGIVNGGLGHGHAPHFGPAVRPLASQGTRGTKDKTAYCRIFFVTNDGKPIDCPPFDRGTPSSSG